MSEFFEPPPLAEPERLEPRPAWWHAPSGMLPGLVALELALARTEQAVVCVPWVGAYPTGFEVDLITIVSRASDELDPLLFGGPRWRGRAARRELQGGAGIPPEMLRFGVEFADGTRRQTPHNGWARGRVLHPARC